MTAVKDNVVVIHIEENVAAENCLDSSESISFGELVKGVGLKLFHKFARNHVFEGKFGKFGKLSSFAFRKFRVSRNNVPDKEADEKHRHNNR